MRILISSIAGYGHICPVIPLALALKRVGHEVAFATSRSFELELGKLGLSVLAVGPDWKESEFATDKANHPPVEGFRTDMGVFFNEQLVPAMTRDINNLVALWKPDIILSNEYEPAGAAVAEKYGLPFALLSYGPRVTRSVRAAWHNAFHNIARGVMRLAPCPTMEYSHRWLHLYFSPIDYVFGDQPYTEEDNEFGIRPEIYDGFGFSSESRSVGGQSSGGRVALCTFGTVFNKNPEVFRAIIDNASKQVDRLLVMLGPGLKHTQLKMIPANVELYRYQPLSAILPNVDFCITHGGTATLMSVLMSGKPSFLLPQGADQIINALTCTQHKLGVAKVDMTMADPTRQISSIPPGVIGEGVTELIENPIYKERCEQFRHKSGVMPTLTFATSLLEQLAATGKPVAK